MEWYDVLTLSIGIVAAAVAIWQLALQRAEVQRSALVTKLMQLHAATLAEIDHRERFIRDKKDGDEKFRETADKVNYGLRPLHLRLTGCIAEVMKIVPSSRAFRVLAREIKTEVIPKATVAIRARPRDH